MGSTLQIEVVETVRGSAGSAPRARLVPGARLWRSSLSWFKPTKLRVSVRERHGSKQIIIRAKNEKCDCGRSAQIGIFARSWSADATTRTGFASGLASARAHLKVSQKAANQIQRRRAQNRREIGRASCRD